jgi:hypothetical protein
MKMTNNIQLYYENKIPLLNYDISTVKQLKPHTKKAMNHQVNMWAQHISFAKKIFFVSKGMPYGCKTVKQTLEN